MTEKKNAETDEPMSTNEVDEIIENEPKKDFDDLVEADEVKEEEKENDSL